MLTLKQQAKWQELNTFFKTNSKYYKKIDNDNIIFNTWAQGAGGDFLSTLFLDSMLDIDLYVSEIAEYIKKVNRYEQIIPCVESRINTAIWLKNGTLDDSFNTQEQVQNLQQQYILTDQVFNLYILFEFPKDKFDVIDNIFKDALTDYKTIKNIQYFKTHNLPVIPYFYYKNPEKIKTIILAYTDDQTLRLYLDILKIIKRDNLVDKNTNELQFDLFPPGISMDVVKETRLVYNEILETIDNFSIAKGVIAELLLLSLKEHEFNVNKTKQKFSEHLKIYIQELNSINLDSTYKQASVDNWYSLTAKPYSGIMDEDVQLHKIDYRKLILEQDDATIRQMMQWYNSDQDILYYKTQIQLYHERNMKLFNQLKTELNWYE
jgi:hypothetical protein